MIVHDADSYDSVELTRKQNGNNSARSADKEEEERKKQFRATFGDPMT